MTRYRILAAFSPLATLLSANVAHAQSTLKNPLNFGTIPQFIAAALKVLVMVALPIIALFIVVSGFMFVFARGNEKRLSDARRNFFYVIIGAILILGAWVLATIIGGTVSQLVGS